MASLLGFIFFACAISISQSHPLGRPSEDKLMKLVKQCDGKVDLVIILDKRLIVLNKAQPSQENEWITDLLALKKLIKQLPIDEKHFYVKIILISNRSSDKEFDASTKPEVKQLIRKLSLLEAETITRKIDTDDTLEAIINATNILFQRPDRDAKQTIVLISSGRMHNSESNEAIRFTNIYKGSIKFFTVPIGHSSDHHNLRRIGKLISFKHLKARLLELALTNESCSNE